MLMKNKSKNEKKEEKKEILHTLKLKIQAIQRNKTKIKYAFHNICC